MKFTSIFFTASVSFLEVNLKDTENLSPLGKKNFYFFV